MPRTVVYLRFPRNRNGFQDPPIVEWSASKERELWSMLKNTSTDLEWHELAAHFGVPMVYILQQAAWLYEKELGILRKRMSRISTSLTQDRSGPSSQGPEDGLGNDAAFARPGNAAALLRESPTTAPSSSSPMDSYNELPKSSSFNSLADENEFSSRRLLSTSRILASDDGSDFSDGSEFGILPAGHNLESSSASSDSTVSQSALEAALIEQSNQSEMSDQL